MYVTSYNRVAVAAQTSNGKLIAAWRTGEKLTLSIIAPTVRKVAPYACIVVVCRCWRETQATIQRLETAFDNLPSFEIPRYRVAVYRDVDLNLVAFQAPIHGGNIGLHCYYTSDFIDTGIQRTLPVSVSVLAKKLNYYSCSDDFVHFLKKTQRYA